VKYGIRRGILIRKCPSCGSSVLFKEEHFFTKNKKKLTMKIA
jgi:DNA-directed RNA polymerase subunit RPC12/RpoP